MIKPRATHVMTIVHGKSEYCLCRSIKSNLRIKHEIIAKDKGEHSIQITGLLQKLHEKPFSDFNLFVKAFSDVEHHRKTKTLQNFRLFIIMDVDDCTAQQKVDFINGKMFTEHWLHPYITPIYNDPDFEKTMAQAGISVTKKKDYITIFPTNHGDLDVDKAENLLKTLRTCTATNLGEYISYCLDIEEEYRNI